MKTSLHLILFLSVVPCIVSGQGQFPQIKWWYDTHDASFGQTAAGDIDLDGRLEVVFGCYRNDSSVYALNAEDGSLLWKYNTHPASAEGCNDAAPVLYDIDGDDSLEVIVPGSCNPRTFCFRGSNGKVQWQTPSAGSDSPPTVGDIDLDGKPEILHGGFDGHVLCINAENGSVAWSLTVNNNSWIQTAPTLTDLDGDGQPDFVVATWAFSPNTDRVYAYRGATHTLLWSTPIPDVMYHGTAVSDLDADGTPELVIGAYNGTLYVLNGEDGSISWEYPADFYIGAPAAIADVDKDGLCEVLFCDAYGVGTLTNAGDLLWYYTIPGYGTAFRGVAMADINGDDTLDVAFGTSTGRVIVLSGSSGAVIWSLNLASHYGNTFEIDHAPVIADFDGDGTIDIFIVGGYTEYPNFYNNYGRGYMISAGAGNGPGWLMFQEEVTRRSSLCDEPPTSVEELPAPCEEFLTIRPNPCREMIEIESVNPGTFELWTLLGQPVMTIGSETNRAVADISSLPAGMYMVKAKSRHGTTIRKFLKL